MNELVSIVEPWWSCDISAGLSIDETAQVTGISPATVKREWNMARAFDG